MSSTYRSANEPCTLRVIRAGGDVMNRIDEDSQLVVNSLREAGVQVSDIYDLVNGPTPREAVPVLVQLLPLLDNNSIKEGVIRALGDKAARGLAAGPLLAELKRLGGTKPLMGWGDRERARGDRRAEGLRRYPLARS
jgi:hypothetical protein